MYLILMGKKTNYKSINENVGQQNETRTKYLSNGEQIKIQNFW